MSDRSDAIGWRAGLQLPLATPAIALFALATACIGWAPAMEFDRSAVALGEWWRLLTAHIAHFDSEHLAFDVAAFLGLGVVCEWRAPARTRWAIAVAIATVSAYVWLFEHNVQYYRGLSGVAVSLFCLLWGLILREQTGIRRVALAALPALALLAKMIYEWSTRSSFFVRSDNIEPLVSAHVTGAIVGTLLAIPRLPLRATVRSVPHVDRRGPRQSLEGH